MLLLFVSVSCQKTPYDKPKKLIKKDEMINMLVDMHLAESTYNHFRSDSAFINVTSSMFYYSILDKYQVPDSIFEKSYVYYASKPRNFDKMYRTVMSKISVLEQEYSGINVDPINIDPSKKRIDPSEDR